MPSPPYLIGRVTGYVYKLLAIDANRYQVIGRIPESMCKECDIHLGMLREPQDLHIGDDIEVINVKSFYRPNSAQLAKLGIFSNDHSNRTIRELLCQHSSSSS